MTPPSYFSATTDVPVVMGRVVCCFDASVATLDNMVMKTITKVMKEAAVLIDRTGSNNDGNGRDAEDTSPMQSFVSFGKNGTNDDNKNKHSNERKTKGRSQQRNTKISLNPSLGFGRVPGFRSTARPSPFSVRVG